MTSSPSGSPPRAVDTDAEFGGRSVRSPSEGTVRLRHRTIGTRASGPPKFADASDVDQPAAEDDAGAIAELRGLVEVVRGQQDRGALGLERPDELPELAPSLGVEARGGLVEEQQLGPPDDAEGDVDAALPA